MIGQVMSYLHPFRSRTSDLAVSRDAERLMNAYGAQAYETADVFSWREDIGLLYVRHPGHWHRVKMEIGRRNGAGLSGESRPIAGYQALGLL